MREEGNADRETRDLKQQQRASYATKLLNVLEPSDVIQQQKTIWHRLIVSLQRTMTRH